MPGDPLVARAFTVLPEITRIPEWEAQVAWYHERGFDLKELRAGSLVYWVLGPWMERLLDEGADAGLLTRLLAMTEELLTSGGTGVGAAAQGMIEYRLFRAGRDGQAAALVGPATARHLADPSPEVGPVEGPGGLPDARVRRDHRPGHRGAPGHLRRNPSRRRSRCDSVRHVRQRDV